MQLNGGSNGRRAELEIPEKDDDSSALLFSLVLSADRDCTSVSVLASACRRAKTSRGT